MAASLSADLRERVLRGAVILGVVLLTITEGLSPFSALTRGPLIAAWLLIIAALVTLGVRTQFFRVTRPSLSFDPVILLCAAGILAVLTLTFITAVYSPPNSSDAMSYHMPRVVYWTEQSSVRFFRTGYIPQIMLQPLAEYLMLHTFVISGGDRLINFIQWTTSLGCIIGVSSVSIALGIGKRGHWVAALFCATIPSGILASSGAKNDYFLAFWLVTAVFFALRLAATFSWVDASFLGAACGLALDTKGTAYLFAPWILVAVLAPAIARSGRRILPMAAIAVLLAFALNTPQYLRNYFLSGSIVGFASAHGDNSFRWRNDQLGWRSTVSNILRHTSEQLGGRSERWNDQVFGFVNRVHNTLGIDVNDPGTTWPGATYSPPRNANHEADSPSRIHLLILGLLGCYFLFRAARGRDRRLALYGASIVFGFVVFCAYLKWQPFMARLVLPLFVLGAPLTGILETLISPTVLQIAVSLLLLDTARLPTLENWVRPLRGSASIFRSSRDSRYFADLTSWRETWPSYHSAIEQISTSQCRVIGIDDTNFQLEYPLQSLLRERNPGILLVPTGVDNPSIRYPPPVKASPCAIVCMQCVNNPRRLALYQAFPDKTTTGGFVIFSQKPR